jgi:hypothetical protein
VAQGIGNKGGLACQVVSIGDIHLAARGIFEGEPAQIVVAKEGALPFPIDHLTGEAAVIQLVLLYSGAIGHGGEHQQVQSVVAVGGGIVVGVGHAQQFAVVTPGMAAVGLFQGCTHGAANLGYLACGVVEGLGDSAYRVCDSVLPVDDIVGKAVGTTLVNIWVSLIFRAIHFVIKAD